MTRALVTILYEDQRSAATGFGLHAFVKSCVFDILNGERHSIEGALNDARPQKGAGNLLRTCREDIDLIAPDGRRVVAVFDDDKIRGLLKLPRSATAERVHKEIRKGCKAPGQLDVILLKDNMESVIDAAGLCAPSIDKKRIEQASKSKDLLERDRILIELSHERERPSRECILKKMPSLAALIDLLCEALRAAPHRGSARKKPAK
ncbi:MAG TPA: hypothetical protein VE093_28920 [Polyangiaceae bacterium]|jgi:hypothetical protein|nr:hypothetical protein [Polyangiaceae bacterium]